MSADTLYQQGLDKAKEAKWPFFWSDPKIEAAELLEKAGNIYEATDKSKAVAAWTQAAELLILLNQPKSASILYRRSYNLIKNVDHLRRSIDIYVASGERVLARDYEALGEILAKSSDQKTQEEALNAFDKAQAVYGSDAPVSSGACLLQKADLLFALNRYDEAIKTYHESGNLLQGTAFGKYNSRPFFRASLCKLLLSPPDLSRCQVRLCQVRLGFVESEILREARLAFSRKQKRIYLNAMTKYAELIALLDTVDHDLLHAIEIALTDHIEG